MSGYILFNIKQLLHYTNSIQPALLAVLQNCTKPFTPSGTKCFPLMFQNIFKRCTKYMIYTSLSSSLYFYPRDMHLEEICHLLEYHCIPQRMPKRVDICFLYSLFSAVTCWSNLQLHCAISRITAFIIVFLLCGCHWVMSWGRKAHYSSFDSWCS